MGFGVSTSTLVPQERHSINGQFGIYVLRRTYVSELEAYWGNQVSRTDSSWLVMLRL
jgi:hypothetical protein